jgi:hypothetical protein
VVGTKTWQTYVVEVDSEVQSSAFDFSSCVKLIEKIGTVHRVTDKGDIRVQYEGNDNRWTIAPDALVKVSGYSVGDYVRVINDEDLVSNLQKGHGEWTDNMRCVSKSKSQCKSQEKFSNFPKSKDIKQNMLGHNCLWRW